MEKYIYELEMKVRDYECDLQGIVNNANYQHYLEHTRHEFLLSTGVSFAGLHEQGVDPVVARINMAFKTPLKSGDEFISNTLYEERRASLVKRTFPLSACISINMSVNAVSWFYIPTSPVWEV